MSTTEVGLARKCKESIPVSQGEFHEGSVGPSRQVGSGGLQAVGEQPQPKHTLAPAMVFPEIESVDSDCFLHRRMQRRDSVNPLYRIG